MLQLDVSYLRHIWAACMLDGCSKASAGYSSLGWMSCCAFVGAALLLN